MAIRDPQYLKPPWICPYSLDGCSFFNSLLPLFYKKCHLQKKPPFIKNGGKLFPFIENMDGIGVIIQSLLYKQGNEYPPFLGEEEGF
jgi:hypothetical protein